MTDKQFEELMKQLRAANENLQSIKENTDLLRQGLVDSPEDSDYIYSIPSMLKQIIRDM